MTKQYTRHVLCQAFSFSLGLLMFLRIGTDGTACFMLYNNTKTSEAIAFCIILAFASERISRRCASVFACADNESYLLSVLLNNPNQVVFFWTWAKRIFHMLPTNIRMHLIMSFETGLLIFENITGNSLFLQISSKDEDFLDLSVDVEQNTSITHCLR